MSPASSVIRLHCAHLSHTPFANTFNRRMYKKSLTERTITFRRISEQGWSSCANCTTLIKPTVYLASCSAQGHKSAKISLHCANHSSSNCERNVLWWNYCFRLSIPPIAVLSLQASESSLADQVRCNYLSSPVQSSSLSGASVSAQH